MMEALELYIPKPEDLWFRQQMLSDPDTMSYNRDWDVSYPGYHRDTGCIDFPPAEWAEWYSAMIGQTPKRFYAYIQRSSDGAWLGDVCFHYTPEKDWWDMGIVLYAPYRGRGYAAPALKLLLDQAFRVYGISRIHNDFEIARGEISAWETHRRAGFRELGRENGFLEMMITKEDYFRENGTDFPEIETQRLTMRPFVPADSAGLQEILGDAETMRFSEPAYTPEKTAEFLNSFLIRRRSGVAVVCKQSGKLIGYILFHPLDKGIYELGWFFHRDYWRQGFAYEACQAIIRYGFQELRIHKIVSETIDLQKSIGLMKKLGMQPEGVSPVFDPNGRPAQLYCYCLYRPESTPG